MTLSEFRKETADMPGDTLLVQSWGDDEGGYFSTPSSPLHIENYVPDGVNGPEVYSPEDIEYEGIKNAVDALVLRPT